MIRALGVIPARFAATRFPGKPLAPLADGTLLSRVWSRARTATRISRLIVATEDERIAAHVRGLGGEAWMTSPAHPSGTDRVAEVVLALGETWDVVLNIQGDEPLLTGSSLDRLVEAFERERPPEMATLAEPLESVDDLFDPNVVKAVTMRDGRALYFSRAPIPYYRGSGPLRADFREALSERHRGPGGSAPPLSGYLKHQGLYAYTMQALLALTRLKPSPLERDEGLEQLRALQAGYTIAVLDSDFRSVAVDSPADLERVAALLMESSR